MMSIKMIKKINIPKVYWSLVIFPMIGLIICFLTQQNKIVVGILGTILFTIILGSYVIMKKNKSFDNISKKRHWSILFILFFIVIIMASRFTGKF